MRNILPIFGLLALATAAMPYHKDVEAGGFSRVSGNFEAGIEMVSMVETRKANKNTTGTRQTKVVVAVAPHHSLTITSPDLEALPEESMQEIRDQIMKNNPFSGMEEHSKLDTKDDSGLGNETKNMEVAMLLPSDIHPEFTLDVGFE